MNTNKETQKTMHSIKTRLTATHFTIALVVTGILLGIVLTLMSASSLGTQTDWAHRLNRRGVAAATIRHTSDSYIDILTSFHDDVLSGAYTANDMLGDIASIESARADTDAAVATMVGLDPDTADEFAAFTTANAPFYAMLGDIGSAIGSDGIIAARDKYADPLNEAMLNLIPEGRQVLELTDKHTGDDEAAAASDAKSAVRKAWIVAGLVALILIAAGGIVIRLLRASDKKREETEVGISPPGCDGGGITTRDDAGGPRFGVWPRQSESRQVVLRADSRIGGQPGGHHRDSSVAHFC